MRAELAGKLSMSSPSPQDRLEDTLTDGVFSTLRYLPRNILRNWLLVVLPLRFHAALTTVAVEGARFEFWPTLPGGAEPDVVIRVGSILVVVEAKYRSPFGQAGGQHQLSVEWHLGRRISVTDALDGPVVVAITADLVQPAGIDAARAQLDPTQLSSAGLTAVDALVWCQWQSVAKVIDAANKSDMRSGDQALVEDLFELMQRREVRFVYEGFKAADWWLLAAAADAATERVYPTIAEFARELTAQGASQGLVWGGTDSGVVWYESKRTSQTDRWHRHYIQLPLLHEAFGRRLRNRCALYVLFTFNDPAIRAGWWFELHASRDDGAVLTRVATWLSNLDPAFDVIDSTQWHHPTIAVERSQLTAEWVQQRLLNDGWFRIERAWAPDNLTSTAPVIDVLSDLARSLCADGSILDSLEADGTLDRSQPPTSVSLDGGENAADLDVGAVPGEADHLGSTT